MDLLSIFRRPAQIEQPSQALDAADRMLDGDRSVEGPRFTCIVSDDVARVRRGQAIDLSLGLAQGDVWPTSIAERRVIASRIQFTRWRLGLANRTEVRP